MEPFIVHTRSCPYHHKNVLDNPHLFKGPKILLCHPKSPQVLFVPRASRYSASDPEDPGLSSSAQGTLGTMLQTQSSL